MLLSLQNQAHILCLLFCHHDQLEWLGLAHKWLPDAIRFHFLQSQGNLHYNRTHVTIFLILNTANTHP